MIYNEGFAQRSFFFGNVNSLELINLSEFIYLLESSPTKYFKHNGNYSFVVLCAVSGQGFSVFYLHFLRKLWQFPVKGYNETMTKPWRTTITMNKTEPKQNKTIELLKIWIKWIANCILFFVVSLQIQFYLFWKTTWGNQEMEWK